jgi:Transglutaminase-like superfamily
MPSRRARAALDLVRAAAAVVGARRIVARRPVGELVERTKLDTELWSDRGGQKPIGPADQRRVERWSVAVDRAMRWLPGDAACLVRASALRALLAANGVPAAVRIGVRRGLLGFAAHAWVEVHGTPIAEPDGLAGAFSSLDGVTLR